MKARKRLVELLFRMWKQNKARGRRPRTVLASRSKLVLNEHEAAFCTAMGRDNLNLINAAAVTGISTGAASKWLKKPKIQHAIGSQIRERLLVDSNNRIQLAEAEIAGEPV